MLIWVFPCCINMKKEMKHELLAPAGSPDILKAVLSAGADAVYLGGEKYGARAFATNFTLEEILSALDYAHIYGKKIFLTVNTLLKNREMGESLSSYLLPLYRHGLDAIIVQDYGVFQFVREHFPLLPVHISTQMSVSNVYGAALLQSRGASRIVTARELSLEEIRRIYDATGVEIESFIHGALCYCYSGQCLMSSLIGGRSGNRGRCAQPCRLAYEVMDERGKILHPKEKYPLSPKDLCTLELLPLLCDAGIYSFKIEGRMKSLEYAAGVTRIYRKYLDLYEENPKSYSVAPADIQQLLNLGNRNGFTRGYYEMHNGRSMMTLTESAHKSAEAKSAYVPEPMKKLPIRGQAFLSVGEPAMLTLSADSKLLLEERSVDRWSKARGQVREAWVTVCGDEVVSAKNRPLSKADIRERLEKTGDTPFAFADLTVEAGENCFLTVKQLNALRRNALEQLREQLLSSYYREMEEPTSQNAAMTNPAVASSEQRTVAEKKNKRPDADEAFGEKTSAGLTLQVSTRAQLKVALACSFAQKISLDFAFDAAVLDWSLSDDPDRGAEQLEEARREIVQAGKQAEFCFPYVFRQDTSMVFEEQIWREVLSRFDFLRPRSYDSLGYCLGELGVSPRKVVPDAGLYVCSQETRDAFARLGLSAYTASYELNRGELAHLPKDGGELCLYGYVPVMVSAQCVYKNYSRCANGQMSGSGLYLLDRYHKRFLIKRSCRDCYNVIFNSQPLYLLHLEKEIRRLGYSGYRLSFVDESPKAMEKCLKEYENAFLLGEEISPPTGKEGFTTGHFRRGVD